MVSVLERFHCIVTFDSSGKLKMNRIKELLVPLYFFLKSNDVGVNNFTALKKMGILYIHNSYGTFLYKEQNIGIPSLPHRWWR